MPLYLLDYINAMCSVWFQKLHLVQNVQGWCILSRYSPTVIAILKPFHWLPVCFQGPIQDTVLKFEVICSWLSWRVSSLVMICLGFKFSQWIPAILSRGGGCYSHQVGVAFFSGVTLKLWNTILQKTCLTTHSSLYGNQALTKLLLTATASAKFIYLFNFLALLSFPERGAQGGL